MPLDRPFAYLVTYDLKGPAANYGPLIEELKRSPAWWHHLESTWLVLRRETLIELGALLRAKITQPDRLLILPAKGPADGWLAPDAWTWINKNLPREW